MSRVTLLAVIVALLPWPAAPQEPAAAAQPVRFAGTWVGTQAWAIENPPPGARQDQPVTLELEVIDGKIAGTLKPFLGGEDGATIVETVIIGDELRATAVVGRPRAPGAAGGRRGGGPGNWKDPVRIAFVFKPDGLSLTGTADVTMGDTPWIKYTYDLSKKRSRY